MWDETVSDLFRSINGQRVNVRSVAGYAANQLSEGGSGFDGDAGSRERLNFETRLLAIREDSGPKPGPIMQRKSSGPWQTIIASANHFFWDDPSAVQSELGWDITDYQIFDREHLWDWRRK